jgi:hypothetical protein
MKRDMRNGCIRTPRKALKYLKDVHNVPYQLGSKSFKHLLEMCSESVDPDWLLAASEVLIQSLKAPRTICKHVPVAQPVRAIHSELLSFPVS